jgi:multidrug efflux pump subunit AcrA (membrane-fusion protein)
LPEIGGPIENNTIVPTRFFLLLLSVSAVACGGASSAAPRAEAASEDIPAVDVVRVDRTPLDQTVTVTGTLAAEEQVMLSLKVTGRLEEMLVDLGSQVRRGQVIARLTPTDFELRLRQAEAALQQARARLGLDPMGEDDTIDIERTGLIRQAQATLEEARRQRDRFATFVQRGISARADLETADAQLQIAEARYQDALEEVRNRQAVLAQRRSELALARQQLEDTTLKSPIDGVVRERLAFAGEYRAAGTPVVTVVRQHPLRLQLAVPERSASEVQVGQLVRVTVEGDAEAYRGRVARLSPAITEGNRTLAIEAEVPNENGRLRTGMFARAEIITSEALSIVVPHSALVVFAGVEKLLLVKDGKVHEQRVRTGRRIDDRVEILEGVTTGDVVITAPGGLAEGVVVRVSE